MAKIGILINGECDPDFSYTREAIQVLLDSGNEVYADRKYHSVINEKEGTVKYFPNEAQLYQETEMLVLLGGDGSVLSKCEKAASFELPIVGVNLGHLGFLSTIEKDEIPLLARIAKGEYKIEDRMMEEIKITDGGISREFCALNEVVISSSYISKLTDIEVMYSPNSSIKYKCDGLIICTPTGSTAYSLSAGGPIIDSSTSLFCITPICSLSVSTRPTIFSSDTVFKIQGKTCGQSKDIFVTADGKVSIKVTSDAIIEVRKSDLVTKLVRFDEGRFYDIVTKKIFDRQ